MASPMENSLPALFERSAMSFSGKPTTFVEQMIENDGFWPDLSVAEFQKGYRLPAEYLVDMLAADLTMAMVEVNADLVDLKKSWQAQGIYSVEIPDPSRLTDEPTLIQTDQDLLPDNVLKLKIYRRAVYCRAKASALQQFATVTRRESAENTGKEAPERESTFLAFSQSAVRALQGRSRITAALL